MQNNKVKFAILASFIVLLFFVAVIFPTTLTQSFPPANSLHQVENSELVYRLIGEGNDFQFSPNSFTWAG